MTVNPKIADILTSWFGAGSLPGPKGTWGSLFALPFAWIIFAYLGQGALFSASIICFILGVIVVDNYVRRTNTKDPSFAVIDEVAGQWLTLVALNNLTIMGFCIGFLLFRLFDILKPPPCRQLENLPEGLGVMLDDMAAGIYAALCLYCLQFYVSDVFII